MARHSWIVFSFLLFASAIISACAPTAMPPTAQSTPLMVPVTGTPIATVIVIPATVPSASAVPAETGTPVPPRQDIFVLAANCYRAGLPTYINREAGFCFAFPQKFTLGEFNPGQLAILGPALDSSPDPLRATLTFQVKPAAGTGLLNHLSAYAVETGTSPDTLLGQVSLDGEMGKVIDPVKGRPNARSVLVLHADMLYILSFAPTLKDTPTAQQTAVWKKGQNDMEALYEVVTSSFAFLSTSGAAEPATTGQPMPMLRDISWQTAQEMIRSGQVTAVSQSHSLQVSLTLRDGRVLHTVEPQLDDVIRVVSQCGETCREIIISTE